MMKYYINPDYIQGLRVNENGDKVTRTYKSKDPRFPDNTVELTIHIDKDGNKYVSLRKEGRIRVDQMVATCFVYKPSGDYLLVHKDGDPRNCKASNLEWIRPFDYNKKFGLTEWGQCGHGYEINSLTGEVRYGAKILTPQQDMYDSDTDSWVVIPGGDFVQLHQKSNRYSIDKLMAVAFLLRPDPSMRMNHKDGDPHNHKLENLEWIY